MDKLKRFFNKISSFINPKDTNYPVKIEEIGEISLKAGKTKFIILIKNKNMSFTSTATQLEKRNIISSFHPDDQEVFSHDLSGDGCLFEYLEKKYNI